MDRDVLFYYSKSKDVYPGTGANESGNDNYDELSRVPNWRHMLSNFYISPFELDGETWGSVEHYYHAQKFKKTNPKFVKQFTWFSGSDFATDSTAAKSAGGKSGGKYRPKSVVADKAFFTGDVQAKVFVKAMFSKFTQNPLLQYVLLKTKNAELWHGTRGVPKHRVLPLEKVRECIKKYKDYDLTKVRLG